jgi:hypothetical protein
VQLTAFWLTVASFVLSFAPSSSSSSLCLSLSEEEENSIVHIFQFGIDFSYCVFQIVTHPLLLSLFSLRRKLSCK